MIKGKKVVVVLPAYNAAKTLERTYAEIPFDIVDEVILTDDKSSDNTVEVVAALNEHDSRICLERFETNQGTAQTRNKATELARGTYVAFLDSDDRWMPEKLEVQLQLMRSTGATVVYSNYLRMDESGRSLNQRVKAIEKLSYSKQRANNYIGNLTGMYNAEVLGKIYSPPFRKRQDWALWMEAIKRAGQPAVGMDRDLAWYRMRTTSISARKTELLKYNYRVYREYLGYSAPVSFFRMMRFLWEYFLVRPRLIERSEL